eukprot:1145806-Pelagomonas_calceolata.AAC.6
MHLNAVQAINSFANIIESVQSRVPVAQLLNINAFDVSRILENEPDFLKVKLARCLQKEKKRKEKPRRQRKISLHRLRKRKHIGSEEP